MFQPHSRVPKLSRQVKSSTFASEIRFNTKWTNFACRKRAVIFTIDALSGILSFWDSPAECPWVWSIERPDSPRKKSHAKDSCPLNLRLIYFFIWDSCMVLYLYIWLIYIYIYQHKGKYSIHRSSCGLPGLTSGKNTQTDGLALDNWRSHVGMNIPSKIKGRLGVLLTYVHPNGIYCVQPWDSWG